MKFDTGRDIPGVISQIPYVGSYQYVSRYEIAVLDPTD